MGNKKSKKNKKRKAETLKPVLEISSSSSSSSSPPRSNGKTTTTMIDIVVNFSIRISLLTAEAKPVRSLSQTAIRLLNVVLKRWPSSTIKPLNFSKLLDMKEKNRSGKTAAKGKGGKVAKKKW